MSKKRSMRQRMKAIAKSLTSIVTGVGSDISDRVGQHEEQSEGLEKRVETAVDLLELRRKKMREWRAKSATGTALDIDRSKLDEKLRAQEAQLKAQFAQSVLPKIAERCENAESRLRDCVKANAASAQRYQESLARHHQFLTEGLAELEKVFDQIGAAREGSPLQQLPSLTPRRDPHREQQEAIAALQARERSARARQRRAQARSASVQPAQPTGLRERVLGTIGALFARRRRAR